LRGPQNEDPSVGDRCPEVEVDLGDGHPLLDLIRQGAGLVRRQVPSHPPVDDRPPVPVALDRSEVDSVGEVAVRHLQTRPEGLERSPSGVVLTGVVAQDGEDRNV
jgi:hypothetical protein